MKHVLVLLAVFFACISATSAADKSGKKIELAHPFYWAVPDSLRGDWEGAGGYVAQVIRADDRLLSFVDQIASVNDEGKYEAHIFRQFDLPNDKPLAILKGVKDGDAVNFIGDGWTGTIEDGHFKATNGDQSFDLEHITRIPPSLGQKPPAGAIVLFDGTNLDAWARRDPQNWLKENGPAAWNLIGNGAMESVPHRGYLLSHRWFADYKLHLEFCNLGGPTSSGAYLETRYETKIDETYGRLDGNACGQFANCTDKSSNPGIRCSRPPLEWQTMDIEFHPPKFDADGKKIASAHATVIFNGVLFYNDQAIGPPQLNAAKLGEAAWGPLMLQEHGMPVQFRNIWAVEIKP